MKLNIVNYNPEVEDNIKNIDQLIELLNDFKINIKTKHYKPYQNFLERLNKYITFSSTTFQKELNEDKNEIDSDNENNENNENNEENENISITSISVYEDYEYIDEETVQIDLFDDICKKKYKNSINNIFDVDITKNISFEVI